MDASLGTRQTGGEATAPPGAGPVHAGEWLILLAAAAALLVRCLREHARPLTCDEAYTAFAMADPSFFHMLEGLRDEINAMPPLSLILGWGIARVIGVSEVALRLPSALFAWVAIVFLWLCLRRSLNRWVAVWCAVCLPLAFDLFRSNATEARCYSLYFASYAAAVGLLLRCGERQELSRRGAWLVTLAHGCLLAVHYVGGLLSGLLVAVALTASFLWPEHRHRYRRYALQGFLGWLAVIPLIPFYLAQRRLGGELNWLSLPGPERVYGELVTSVSSFVLFLAALLVWALVAEGRQKSATSARRTPELLWLVILLVVASQVFFVAVWVESRFGPNIFLDRYLFPLSLAWMLAIAFLADMLAARLWQREPSAADRGMGIPFLADGLWGRWLVLVTAAVLSLVVAGRMYWPKRPGAIETEGLQAMRQHPGIQVVTSGAHLHSELGWYGRGAGGAVLLNDSHYHDTRIGLCIGAALERNYPPQSLRSLPECAQAFDSFLFVNPQPNYTDVETFLRGQPGWRSTKLGPHTTLWDRRPEDASE